MAWKKQLDRAVRFRESGNLEESRKLFGPILEEIAVLKESQDPRDRKEYVGVIGQWIIQLRLEGKRSLHTALEEAKRLVTFANQNQLDARPAIRGISNTLMNLEHYELAQPYLEQMLTLVSSDQSTTRGDIQAHLARCMFRTGKMTQAAALIDEALTNIDKNSGNLPGLAIAANKTHALWTKSLIELSLGNQNDARTIAMEAMALAQKHDLAFRQEEIKRVLETIAGPAI